MKAEEKNVGYLLTNKIFHIPEYQRPYCWEEEQVTDLLNDIKEAMETKQNVYFLGSLVLSNNKKGNDKEVYIIDGQQRMTTIVLLFSVIAHLDEKLKPELMEILCHKKNVLDALSKDINILNYKNKDENDFFAKYVLNDQDELFGIPRAQIKDIPSRKCIERNILNIKSYIQKNNLNVEEYMHFISNNCYFSVVSSDDENEALRIFNVLNTRGLPLLDSDILKTYFIKKLTNNEIKDKFIRMWERNESLCDRECFNQFFSHLRMIYAKSKPKSGIREELEKYLDENVKDFNEFVLNDLDSYLSNYLWIINPKNSGSDEKNKKINTLLNLLNMLNNKDWIPLVLCFMKYNTQCDEKLEQFLYKLDIIANYLLFTGANTNRRLKYYSNILKNIERDKEKFNIDTMTLSEEDNNRFVNVIIADLYYNLPYYKVAHLLKRLEIKCSDINTLSTINFDNFTIEHIMPQTLANGWEKVFNTNQHSRYVNKIGNLTPLSNKKNSQAHHLDFKSKCDYYLGVNEKNPSFTQYGLTNQLVQKFGKTGFGIKELEERQENMVDLICDMWALDKKAYEKHYKKIADSIIVEEDEEGNDFYK